MRKITLTIITAIICTLFTACGNSENKQGNPVPPKDDLSYAQTKPVTTDDDSKTDTTISITSTSENQAVDDTTNGNGILIAYFSRADENYNVGVIDKGNTEIIAEIIAEQTGGDMFKIETVNAYPADYDECTKIAKQEQNDNARPNIKADVDGLENYETVFLGYPIWWGDMPMVMYTFMESHDFSGKNVIPFCTHAGSRTAGTDSVIASVTGAEVGKSFAIQGETAQKEQDKAKSLVSEWLNELNY